MARDVSSGINAQNPTWLLIPVPRPRPAPQPACKTTAEVGVDIGGGVKLDTEVVADGAAGIAACAASCCNNTACSAWVVAASDAPDGAAPIPCEQGKPCCWRKSTPPTSRPPCKYCTSGVTRGSPAPGSSVLNEQVGGFALHVPTTGGVTPRVYTGGTLQAVYSAFGASAGPRPVVATAVHGAASGTVSVPPGGNATVTVVFGWRFPTRYMSGQEIGNHYADIHANASAAAEVR